MSGQYAEELLGAAVRVGPWPIPAMREIMHGVGITDWQIRRAVSSLTKHDKLTVVYARYWTSPSFINDEGADPLFVEGHSREQLIARLSRGSQSSHVAPDATASIMQGDDAERLARDHYSRYGD